MCARGLGTIGISRLKPLLSFLFFLLALALSVFLFHNGELMPTKGGVGLYANRATIAKHFGQSDYATYAKGAEVLRTEGVQSYADRGFKNFAPGVSFLQMFFTLLSENAPIPLCFLSLTLILWACVFHKLQRSLKGILGFSSFAATLIPLSLLLAPFFSQGLLWDGVLISEATSTPLFVLGVLSLWSALSSQHKSRKRDFVLTALFFCCASYIRAQFDVMFILIVIFLAALSLIALRLRACAPWLDRIRERDFLIGLLLMISVYIALTFSYRLTIGTAFMARNDYVWQLIWHDQDFFEKNGGEFFSSGGGHVICLTNPAKCSEFAGREQRNAPPEVKEAVIATVKTIAEHPVTYFSLKLPYLWRNWQGDFFGGSVERKVISDVVNKEMVYFLPVSCLIMFIYSRERRFATLSYYSLSFLCILLGAIGFSIFIHIEPRYFLPIKLFLYLTDVTCICYALQKFSDHQYKE